MFGFLSKVLTSMRHSGRSSFFFDALLPRTNFDYKKEIGDGTGSSVVMAPLQWLQRSFMEADLKVFQKGPNNKKEEIEGHPLVSLLSEPNPFFDSSQLWASTLFSYVMSGNAYWIKVKDGVGNIKELWYTPHWLVKPKWPDSGNVFISHYEYNPGGGAIDVKPEDLVHFRNGVDPNNIRLGISPLHGALREIFMDMEASNFVGSLLKNSGIPGLLISPDSDDEIDPDDADEVKAWFKERFGGDRRGEPLVMTGKTKVEQYGYDPKTMDLSVVRDVAEERICASLGIPSAVVGFGTGMQQTKVGATMSELRREAWANGMMPLQRSFAESISRFLLPEFARTRGFRRGSVLAEFDNSNVMALQEDFRERSIRVVEETQSGLITIGEGRQILSYEVKPEHDVYMVPSSTNLVVPSDLNKPQNLEDPQEDDPEDEDPEDSENEEDEEDEDGKVLKVTTFKEVV